MHWFLNICLKKPISFEKLPFEKTEPNNDKNKIDKASGIKTNLIIYAPVSNKKTEKELNIVADFAEPDKVNNPIKIGNNIPAKENNPSISISISSKKLFINNKIVVANKKENKILSELFSPENLLSENDLKISYKKIMINKVIKKRKLFLISLNILSLIKLNVEL